MIAALCDAAEIEHSITCQYLFAAFSLKVHPDEGVDWARLERIRDWKGELLSMARQEMMHHGLVCNLLLAIGGAPHFRRAAFPHAVRFCAPYSMLDLLPFCDEALERFAAYERRHAPNVETGSTPGSSRTIDGLYLEIREGLEHIHRTSSRFFVGPIEHQITNQDLRIRPGQFDVDLSRVSNPSSALAVIDRIRDHGHQERIEAIRQDLAELTRADPTFAPARPVVVNPRAQAPQKPSEGGTLIRHPQTRSVAEIFNAAYEVMLLMLARLYGRSDEGPAETDGLIRTAFFPLMTAVIRPLGEILTLMPVAEDGSPATAGACFEFPFAQPLPPTRRTAWLILHERLAAVAHAAMRLRDELKQSQEPWAHRVLSRFEMVCENLERITGNFARYMSLERESLLQMFKRFK